MTASTRDRANAPQRRDVTINLRAPVQLRELIDRAAAAVGKTRSEFMLDSARNRAEDVLLDRRLFLLDEAQYEAFVRTLDAPPRPGRELRALLSRRAPWDK